MLSRTLLCVLAGSVALTSCSTPYKEKDEKEKRERQGERDFTSDQSFQAFLGRLRTAASKRDRVMLAAMMTREDFGYRWDPAPAGESVFDYWDQKGLWPELVQALQRPFTPYGTFMVARPEKPSDYTAGLTMVGGSWRFAYFVPPEPVAPAPEPEAPSLMRDPLP